MTIKEFVKKAFTENGQENQAVKEGKATITLAYSKNNIIGHHEYIRYVVKIDGIELEEEDKGFAIVDSFKGYEIIENRKEPLYHDNRRGDYTMNLFFQHVFIDGISRPLLNFSNGYPNQREHIIRSKIIDGKVGFELKVELKSGDDYLKGYLLPKE